MKHLHPVSFLRRGNEVICWTLAALSVFCLNAEMSDPSGMTIVRGSGSASTQGSQVIFTVSDDTILSLASMEVRHGQSWTFRQPSAASSLKILVRGGCSACIDGEIHAIGHVSLINDGGLEIGAEALIDVGTLSIRTRTGEVLNHGRLVAAVGDVDLRSPIIRQFGKIDLLFGGGTSISLEADRELHLGSNSVLMARGGWTQFSPGGHVKLKSSRLFRDETGSQIDVSGGGSGGDGGTVEICATEVSAIRSRIEGGAYRGGMGGRLTIDPTDIILSSEGTDSAGSGTVLASDTPDTLRLNVGSVDGFGSAFVGFSQIHLEATRDISLAPNTVWDLNLSTGISDSGNILSLEAGRNIMFGDNSQLIGGTGWSVRCAAGVVFSSPQHSSQIDFGGIYFNGTASLETLDGSIFMQAGHEIVVGGGLVGTIGGGSLVVVTNTVLVTALGRGTTESVVRTLITLQSGVTNQEDSAKLADAMLHLTHSLAITLWLDETHLQPTGGEKVFNGTKQAVHDLRLLLTSNENSVAAAELEGLVDQLIQECRLLALVEIQDAVSQSARAKQVNQAESKVAKGDQSIADGHFEIGLDDYRNAWQALSHLR